MRRKQMRQTQSWILSFRVLHTTGCVFTVLSTIGYVGIVSTSTLVRVVFFEVEDRLDFGVWVRSAGLES